jgi:hypothetical protein
MVTDVSKGIPVRQQGLPATECAGETLKVSYPGGESKSKHSPLFVLFIIEMNHLLSKWNFKVKSFHFEYVPVRPLHLKKKSWSHQVLIVYRKMVPFCCCY